MAYVTATGKDRRGRQLFLNTIPAHRALLLLCMVFACTAEADGLEPDAVHPSLPLPPALEDRGQLLLAEDILEPLQVHVAVCPWGWYTGQ